jgi:hypothetical protein
MRLSRLFHICYVILISCVQSQAQSIMLSGRITDATTHEPLIGATVFLKKAANGTATDTGGFYVIQSTAGPDTLVISYLGYTTKELPIQNIGDQKINIVLSPTAIQTKEVIITGDRNNNNVTSTEMSTIEIKGETIKNLPVIFGEPDVLKAITLLPGIKSGGEGGTGFYVRGGGPDQNLVLMDGAVIYNPAHLLGFLSVFNTDAVNNVEIIKGGMPANYGGRLSSVLNVNLREGNDEKYVLSGGIGLISSRLMYEGPIKKKKSGFMIAARRTYIDALVKPLLPREQRSNGYYFYDFNVKLHYYFTPKDKIYFSGYLGKDIFNFQSPTNQEVKFATNWGNTAATLRWNHVFRSRFYVNTSLIYNRFDLRSQFSFGNDGFTLSSGLQDWNLKQDYVFTSAYKHTLKFGWIYTYHTFTPGIAKGQIGTIKVDETITKQYAHEMALYLSDEWKIGSRFTLNGGLRGVLFMQVGPFTEAIFNDDDLQIGTGRSFAAGEPIVVYPGLEPRLAATYLLNSSTSVKASFTQTHQFLHLATTSGAQFPTDLWVPSSQKVKPQLARQYALGLFKNFMDNEFETSVEAYYKPMYNQIEFKPGAQLFFNQNLENEMIFGKGLSYGIEFFVKKKFGKITGWAGYTWSKTTRQFDELNRGEAYYYRYDRTHDMSLVVSYQFNKKWSGTLVFVYGTGNAATLPTARYAYEPGYNFQKKEPKITFVDLYDRINDYRLPAYHRMDVSFTYIQKKTERFESSWNFSIYNIYNRANPYFIYFAPNLQKQNVQAYMVYLFPILPSIAWNFRF